MPNYPPFQANMLSYPWTFNPWNQSAYQSIPHLKLPQIIPAQVDPLNNSNNFQNCPSEKRETRGDQLVTPHPYFSMQSVNPQTRPANQPWLTIIANSTEFHMLADTGASLSLWPRYLLPDAESRIKNEDCDLRDAQDNLIPILGKVKIEFRFKGSDQLFQHTFFVSDVAPDSKSQIILGSDFLIKQKIMIDFRSETLQIPNKNLTFKFSIQPQLDHIIEKVPIRLVIRRKFFQSNFTVQVH